jgi:hypothetical protein
MPIKLKELKVGDILIDTDVSEVYYVIKVSSKKFKMMMATLSTEDGHKLFLSADRESTFKEYLKQFNNNQNQLR